MKQLVSRLLAIGMLLAMSTIAVMAEEFQFTRNGETITVRTGTSGGECNALFHMHTYPVPPDFIGVTCADGDIVASANAANGCDDVVFPASCGVGEDIPVYLNAYGTLNCGYYTYYVSAGGADDGGCDFSGSGDGRSVYCSDGSVGNSQYADCTSGCGDTAGSTHCCCEAHDEGCGQGPRCNGEPNS